MSLPVLPRYNMRANAPATTSTTTPVTAPTTTSVSSQSVSSSPTTTPHVAGANAPGQHNIFDDQEQIIQNFDDTPRVVGSTIGKTLYEYRYVIIIIVILILIVSIGAFIIFRKEPLLVQKPAVKRKPAGDNAIDDGVEGDEGVNDAAETAKPEKSRDEKKRELEAMLARGRAAAGASSNEAANDGGSATGGVCKDGECTVDPDVDIMSLMDDLNNINADAPTTVSADESVTRVDETVSTDNTLDVGTVSDGTVSDSTLVVDTPGEGTLDVGTVSDNNERTLNTSPPEFGIDELNTTDAVFMNTGGPEKCSQVIGRGRCRNTAVSGGKCQKHI